MRAVIKNISFGVMSEEDIQRMSAIEITSPKMEESGSVSDPRLGLLSSNGGVAGLAHSESQCPTCKMSEQNCPGHMGYVRLRYALIHPLFQKYLLKLLGMFCYQCGRFMRANLDGSYPEFSTLSVEKTICPHCCSQQQTWSFIEDGIRVKCGDSILMTPRELRIFLVNFDKEDLKRISVSQFPENFIMTLLPVCPPCTRPPLHIDGQLHDDHLTIQYNEIVKINMNIKDPLSEEALPILKKLYNKISNLYEEKGKAASSGAMVAKPIKARLSGKDGNMRGSVVGKRVDKSARSVIGPEPTLLMHQVGVPKDVADVLTAEEYVMEHNIDSLNKAIHASRDIYFIYGLREGKPCSFNTLHIEPNFKLQIGDRLDRKLRNGDIVSINRQPTLHKGSFISFETVIHPSKTICFNLCNTKTFNADFDGDEMNLHVPQGYNARYEQEELSTPKNHLLSQRNGKPNIVLVQDNILALYLMSLENMPLERWQFFDLMMFLVGEDKKPWSFEKISECIRRLKGAYGEAEWHSSRAVISLCLPETLDYVAKGVCIEKGIFIEGLFDKSLMIDLFDNIFHIYSSDVSEMVVNNLQILGNHWLRLRGFSVGLEDCIIHDGTVSDQLRTHVEKSLFEADITSENVKNPKIREIKIQEALTKAQAIGQKIAKQGFGEKNNFSMMIKSGAKGDYFNVSQISGLLGQQYLKGSRIPMELNNGTRALCHYPFDVGSQKYEAKGFISSCFYKGLNPREMYFHAVAGRSGVVDTAMGTSETGYMQRRIVKLVEDVKVAYDGTVRNDMNQILQFKYGNGFDVVKEPRVKYLDTLVSKLNNEYENLNGW